MGKVRVLKSKSKVDHNSDVPDFFRHPVNQPSTNSTITNLPLNHPHLYNKVILPSPFLLPSYSSPRFSPLRRDNKVILYPFSPSRSKCIYVSMRVKFIGGQISFIGHFITFIVKKVPDPPPIIFIAFELQALWS